MREILTRNLCTISKPLDSNTVTSMLISAFQNHRANLKRWLGLSLLIFIFYGTIVEAAHRHGRILPAASGAASITDPHSTNATSSTQPGCSDCLICQLHQNFSATLISVKPIATLVSRLTYLRRSVPVSIRSIANSPQSGRAPPQAN